MRPPPADAGARTTDSHPAGRDNATVDGSAGLRGPGSQRGAGPPSRRQQPDSRVGPRHILPSRNTAVPHTGHIPMMEDPPFFMVVREGGLPILTTPLHSTGQKEWKNSGWIDGHDHPVDPARWPRRTGGFAGTAVCKW